MDVRDQILWECLSSSVEFIKTYMWLMLFSSTYGYVLAWFWLSVSIRVAGDRISLWLLVNSLLTNLIDLVITEGVLVVLYCSEKKTEICCVFIIQITVLFSVTHQSGSNRLKDGGGFHSSPFQRSSGKLKVAGKQENKKISYLNHPWEEEAVLDDQINALWYRAILSYFLSWLQRAKMVMRWAVILGFQLLGIKIESCWKEENSRPPYEYLCCISVEFWSESVLQFA